MKYLYYYFLPLIVISIDVAAAVDKDSSAYQAGVIAGRIIVAVLVLLIVWKVFFKKRE